MADELQTKRIIDLAQKTNPETGDNMAVDNATSGTRRITWANLLDNTLSDDTKAAPAGVTGQAIEDAKSTFTDLGDGNVVVNYNEDDPAGTEVPLQSIRFPLLPYKYTVPVIGTGAGQAADAKVVDNINTDLETLIGNIPLVWEQGGMYAATGIEYSSPSNIRTPFFEVSAGKRVAIFNPGGLTLAAYQFSQNVTTASGTNERIKVSYHNNPINYLTLESNCNYLRLQLSTGDLTNAEGIIVQKSDNAIASGCEEVSAIQNSFIMYNKNYDLTNERIYIDRLSAIHSVKLIGFDAYQMCRLRFIARNHATYKYRFIICAFDGQTWDDVFDATSNFTLTENQNGDTFVSCTIGTKTVEMYIDYPELLTLGESWNIDMPTGNYRYIFSPVVFSIHNKHKLYVSKTNDPKVSIISRYSDTEDLKIEFTAFGVNSLFSPSLFARRTTDVLKPDFTGFTNWFTVSTDLVAPYAGITDIAYPSTSLMTVGGNHGTNGGGGFPTAERKSIDVYVDEEQVENNRVYSGDCVKVVVKTHIAASNTINTETGDFIPVLEEITTWIITPNNIEVCVEMKALTDITIHGYTGLQMVCTPFSSVYFNDGTGEKTISNVRIGSQTYPAFKGNRSVLVGSSDICVLYTNRGVGIGDLSHIQSGQDVAFVSAYGKLYQHLIRSIPLALNEGESAFYSGGYTFMSSYNCEGAKSAYFIRLNGKDTYCVDFLNEGTCYAILPVKCVGHQAEVIKKDDTINISPVVTGRGFRVDASGIGSVNFNIE